jgi:hypothetical protein
MSKLMRADVAYYLASVASWGYECDGWGLAYQQSAERYAASHCPTVDDVMKWAERNPEGYYSVANACAGAMRAGWMEHVEAEGEITHWPDLGGLHFFAA